MRPNYRSFGVCPAAVADPNEFCINDDIAVITLGGAAPGWVNTYAVDPNMPGMDTPIVHVGFRTTGNSVTGHTAGSAGYFVKRPGMGHIDRPLDELNDEQNFAGAAEVWVSDFDSAALGIDRHCTDFSVCSPIPANNVETNLGVGDSRGPSFMMTANGPVMVDSGTFDRRFFDGQVNGTFGTAHGGMILGACVDFLETSTGGAVNVVPEAGTYALMALELFTVGAAARGSKAA